METWEVNHRIVSVLRERDGAFVEWEELGRLIDLDRSALESRVAVLRGCGYEIDERAGAGIRLAWEPESLTADQAQSVIPEDFIADVRSFGVVGSTNELARRLAREIPGSSAIILAEAQTKGRGRYERRWFSPPGVGLWFSLVLWPKLEAAKSSSLGLLASVAVASAIRKRHSLPAAVKWPNDVLIEGRKVCGILSELAEARQRTCAIVGIGMNVNQREEDFPQELRQVACSLRMHVGSVVDRLSLLGAILSELAVRYDRFDSDGFEPFQREWESLSTMMGRKVRVVEGTSRLEGAVRGVSESGALVLRDDQGTEHEVIAGDVQVLD